VGQELYPSTAPSHPPSAPPTVSITMDPTDTRTCPNWEQRGTIDTAFAFFSMSSSGSVVAVREGDSVRIYELDDDSMTWNLLADPINMSFTTTNEVRYNIALSSDGSVVAISDQEYNSKTGRVHIFTLHPNKGWIRLGPVIEGETNGDRTGYSMVLSADGTAIALGSPYYNSKTGHVRIFTYNMNNQSWGQQGAAIRGEVDDDFSGWSVAISRNGSIVAVGARQGNNSGRVRVFYFDDQSSNWVQQGSNIDGEGYQDYSGHSIDLSADGSVVAVVAYGNNEYGYESGHVRVFKYEANDKDWMKRGDDIDGEKNQIWSGYSVAISANGTAIAIGAIENDGSGQKSGYLRVYDFDSINKLWVQRGKDVRGESANDNSGYDVSMSADGSIIGTNGKNTNTLRIFQWTLCDLPPTSIPTSVPDCADGKTPLRLDLTTDRFPKQTSWQVTNLENNTVLNGDPYDKLFSYYQKVLCLDDEACYRFTIQDSASNGICCDWFSGNGIYELYFDSFLIQEGGNFTAEESSILFGGACPSPVPSMIPSSKPSTRPTTSTQPSAFPTKVPSNQPSNYPTESLLPSNVPSNSPTKACPVGSFANSTAKECQLCPPGTYQNAPSYSYACSNCKAGEYQPNEGQTKCLTCNTGQFQPQQGQVKCEQCRAGGYCSSNKTGACDGGFIPCPIGTHNNAIGQDNATACRPCPAGTFADNNIGSIQCPQCPFRLSSHGGRRSVCTFCDVGFFLNDTNVPSQSLFERPDNYCKNCPLNAECTTNTSLATLQISAGFWRDSLKASTIYKCQSSDVCKSSGHPQNNINDYCIENHSGPLCESCVENNYHFSRAKGKCIKCPDIRAQITISCVTFFIGAIICVAIYAVISGSRWKKYVEMASLIIARTNLQAKLKILVSFLQVVVTIEKVYGVRVHNTFTKFFSVLNVINLSIFQLFPGECIGTLQNRIILSSLWPLALVIIIFLFTLLHMMIMKKIQSRCSFMNQSGLHNSEDEEHSLPARSQHNIDMYTDLGEKSLDSNRDTPCRVMDTFKDNETVYSGVQHIQTMGNNHEQAADIDLEDFHDNDTIQRNRQFLSKFIYIGVVIFYLVLPSVSSAIFDAIICQAFDTNDEEGKVHSYLVADWSIQCTNSNTQFETLTNIFWGSFSLWIIVVPLIFLGLLISIRKSVYSNRTSFLTEACRFLWRDYKEHMMFWEILDIARKLFLTGIVNFIDLEEGSTKILRLVTAIMISALYLGVLALARPYKKSTDLHIAFISNVVLICFFSTGIVIHICQDDEMCKRQIGASINSFTATLIAVIMTCIMLATTMVSIGYITIHSINAPTIRVVSTDNRPNMEIPSCCQNHIFLSHKWETGQEKVHTLVRMMQLYLQGVKLWLDVDDLEDIARLEESVKESAVFTLFYTDGYFASVNCRREIYAAVAANKPIMTVYVNDSTAIDDMKRECHACCTEDPGSDVILEHVLADTPILWLGNSAKLFSLASIELIALNMLRHLPFYRKNSEQLVEGVRIERERDNVHILSPLVIYTCSGNGKVSEIAKEIKDAGDGNIQIKDAEEFSTIETQKNVDRKKQCEVLLLYLNKDVFKDVDGRVSELVKVSLEKEMRTVLVYEQDAKEGSCGFNLIMCQTPDELLARGLFDELAIPLYTISEYRSVCLSLLLQRMSDICSSIQNKAHSNTVQKVSV